MVLQFAQVIMLVAGCAALSVGVGSGLSGSSLGPAVGSSMFGQAATAAVNADAKVVAVFQDQIQKYIAVHKKAESSLPGLPKEATPEQIDKNQRELARLIQEARTGARQGEIFVPEMQTFVRSTLTRLFTGAAGRELKASVMDENPVDVKVAVNVRYPDELPLSTMPPQVLAILPEMPEELEYRFVGRNLVILDSHAHIIADFVSNVLP